MAPSPGVLDGQRCLLVGGTGGLGVAAARRFLAEGADVMVAGLDGLQSVLAHAELSNLGRCAYCPCDAAEPDQVERLFASMVKLFGGLDVLFHLAGGSGRPYGDGALHECTDQGWRATMDLNLTSTFLTNRAAVRHFLAAKQPGVILNTTSVLALSPSPKHFDTSAYAAAKGGIIALSRQAAARYAADGIRVNVLAPGLIDTPMAQRALGNATIQKYLRNKQPLRQGAGAPEDCAGAAVFLCGPAASFITGAVLPVDGGWCVSEGLGGGK